MRRLSSYSLRYNLTDTTTDKDDVGTPDEHLKQYLRITHWKIHGNLWRMIWEVMNNVNARRHRHFNLGF